MDTQGSRTTRTAQCGSRARAPSGFSGSKEQLALHAMVYGNTRLTVMQHFVHYYFLVLYIVGMALHTLPK